MLLSAAAPPVAVTAVGVTPSAAGGPERPVARPVAPDTTTLPTTTTSTSSTTTSTTTTTAPSPSSDAGGVPPYGRATAYGCASAIAYLEAYAAPGFSVSCPGDALGHEGMSCYSEAPCAPGQRMIAIATPCPAAYMNEAHNSWVLVYEVDGRPVPDGNTALDPYGSC